MYPAALHTISIQIVDSSQVFQRCILQKQPKMIIKNEKKLGQKHNQQSGTGLSQAGPRFSLLIVAVTDKFYLS